MNERIRELAHKADFIIKKNNGAEWRWGHIDPELAEKLEKFAELIVKECVSVMYEDNGATHHCELLFTHFGVEE